MPKETTSQARFKSTVDVPNKIIPRPDGRASRNRGFSACLKDLQALVGRQYVYRDKSSIRLVRLTGIHLEDDYFEFDLAQVSAPGFHPKAGKSFSIGCVIEDLSIEKAYCYASTVS